MAALICAWPTLYRCACGRRLHWNRWIQADALLANLLPSLPDAFFAGRTHLNEAGQKKFTAILGSQLSELMDPR
jgi:hypothetical protein